MTSVAVSQDQHKYSNHIMMLTDITGKPGYSEYYSLMTESSNLWIKVQCVGCTVGAEMECNAQNYVFISV